MLISSQSVVRGSIAGALATIPMTAVMIVGHRRLPRRHRDPLPPAQITQAALETVELDHDLSAEQHLGLTLVNHFAYGAALGAIYSLAMIERSKAPPAVAGSAFGLAAWGVSYLGLLPSLGLYRSATEEPRDRNLLMIAAHVAWGVSLGLLADETRGPSPLVESMTH